MKNLTYNQFSLKIEAMQEIKAKQEMIALIEIKFSHD